MKKTLLLIFLAVSPTFAQDQQHQVSLEKKEIIQECVQLHEKGFILKTGTPFLGKRTNTLFFFTAQGEPVWKQKIENQYQAIKSENLTVASPDGSMVYHIEMENGRFAKGTHYLTQINQKGEARKHELTISETYGKHLLSVFCDEQFLYYLTSRDGNELKDKKKAEDRLILNRFDHKKLNHQQFILDLPAISEPEITSFWTYAGQYKGEKYLLSKKINPDDQTNEFNLFSIDSQGKVLRKVVLPYTLADKYTRPANCISIEEGQEIHFSGRNLIDLNFERGTFTTTTYIWKAPGAAAGPASTMTSTYATASANAGAMSYLSIDATNGALYIYGLFGPRPFRRLAPGYEGFYIYKFDMNGKELWHLQDPGPKELLDATFYTTHGQPQDRHIGLFTSQGQKVTLSISFFKNFSAKRNLFLFDISPSGQVVRNRFTREKDPEAKDASLIPVANPTAEAYLKKQVAEKGDELSALPLSSAEGEILVLIDHKSQKLNVLHFSHQQ